MVKGNIAILVGQADEEYQQGFIHGAMKKAFELGYSVSVFSMYIKYQNTKEREIGDSNIFKLVNYELFDAIIIISDSIQTPGLSNQIEEKLYESFKGPVLTIDSESKYFPSFQTDGYRAAYKLISFMIEKCGLSDIAYLTGRKNHIHSKRRLEAYIDAMKNHGLSVSDDRILYGDFWYTSGVGAAEELLRNRDNIPEAVACANDCMAIGLADELTRKGLRIPEDIKVAGYGSSLEGYEAPKSLTSVAVDSKYYGESAMENILNMLNGQEVKAPKYEPEIFVGESCGYIDPNFSRRISCRSKWMADASDEGYYSIHNTLLQDMLSKDNLDDFLNSVYENIYQLKDIKKFSIMLNDLWLLPEYMCEKEFPDVGYSKHVLNALSFDRDNNDELILGIDKIIDSEKVFPSYDEDNPAGYIFTPLFHENNSLGYAMVSYGNEPRSYDEVYRLWITEVCEGLECLRRIQIIHALKSKISSLESIKFSVAGRGQSDSQKKLSEADIMEINEVDRLIDNNEFKYHFQPIVNATDGSIYSYEALMRSGSEWKISPLQIIKDAGYLGRLGDIEKATFMNVLKIVSDHRSLFEQRKVFINSIPGLSLEADIQKQIEKKLLEFSGCAVVELTEQHELKDAELERIKALYNKLGVGIAVDDYGTGYSNVSNLLRYMPDIVKIDRSLLTEIQSSSQKQHFVRDIIEFCHGNNILALAEGVETLEELKTVIRLGADLIQGYYTARPSEVIIDSIDDKIKQEIVYIHNSLKDGSGEREYIAGRVNRISVSNLIKDNKSTIILGSKNATFRDITLVGTPGLRSKLNIMVLEGYDGRVTLENVYLAHTKGRPCINIGKNCKLNLRLLGNNHLVDGGIRVPESSVLTIEGEGSLSIINETNNSYGIGGDLDSANGIINFYQDGEVRIEAIGQKTVALGSGLGGPITINRGKYDIRVSGDEGVGIGAVSGNVDLSINNCAVTVDISVNRGVCVGSLKNDSDIRVWDSFIECNANGKQVVALGSIEGARSKVDIHDMGASLNLNADKGVGVGCFDGTTDFVVMASAFRFTGKGDQLYVYGGQNTDTNVSFTNSDVNIDVKSQNGGISKAPEENINVTYGRYRVILNDDIVS
ncbi:MAG: EAL domain-containing protein [Eubacterium sp.]|nr:EAL domain-containing protein [Eubacterium sp.]